MNDELDACVLWFVQPWFENGRQSRGKRNCAFMMYYVHTGGYSGKGEPDAVHVQAVDVFWQMHGQAFSHAST